MVEKIVSALDDDAKRRTVAVLGLTLKPETDDMREAPSVTIIRGLLDRGASIRAYDPAAMAEAGRMIPEMVLCKDVYEALAEADVMVIVTEWNEFRMIDLPRAKELMAEPRMVDLRNIYDRERMVNAGFEYSAVGR